MTPAFVKNICCTDAHTRCIHLAAHTRALTRTRFPSFLHHSPLLPSHVHVILPWTGRLVGSARGSEASLTARTGWGENKKKTGEKIWGIIKKRKRKVKPQQENIPLLKTGDWITSLKVSEITLSYSKTVIKTRTTAREVRILRNVLRHLSFSFCPFIFIVIFFFFIFPSHREAWDAAFVSETFASITHYHQTMLAWFHKAAG